MLTVSRAAGASYRLQRGWLLDLPAGSGVHRDSNASELLLRSESSEFLQDYPSHEGPTRKVNR